MTLGGGSAPGQAHYHPVPSFHLRKTKDGKARQYYDNGALSDFNKIDPQAKKDTADFLSDVHRYAEASSLDGPSNPFEDSNLEETIQSESAENLNPWHGDMGRSPHRQPSDKHHWWQRRSHNDSGGAGVRDMPGERHGSPAGEGSSRSAKEVEAQAESRDVGDSGANGFEEPPPPYEPSSR